MRAVSSEQRVARKILEESIVEGLRQIVGEAGYQLVNKMHPIDLAAADPRRLHEVLVSVFLENGAVIIEREIAKSLLAKLASSEGFDNRKVENGQRRPGGEQEHAEVLRRFARAAGLPGVEKRGGRAKTADLGSTALSFAEAFTS